MIGRTLVLMAVETRIFPAIADSLHERRAFIARITRILAAVNTVQRAAHLPVVEPAVNSPAQCRKTAAPSRRCITLKASRCGQYSATGPSARTSPTHGAEPR